VEVNRPAMRPEHELLLCIARTRGAEAGAERVHQLIRAGIEWPVALMAAVDHGVVPLLHRNFFVLGPGAAPARIVRDLRALHLANAYRNLALTAELGRVLGVFEAAGVPVATYGGPLLAALAYGDTALRQASPLDLLVNRTDLDWAAALLRDAGYAPSERSTPRQVKHQEKHAGVRAFVLSDPEVALNVHWRFAASHVLAGPDPRAALENRRQVAFGGRTAPSLDPDDMLLVLVLEGTLGRWRRLAMVCDVAELLSSREAWEWPGLLERARAEGSLRMLLLGSCLAAQLLSAPVPPDVLELAVRDADVVALRRRVTAALFDPRAHERPPTEGLRSPTPALDRGKARVAWRWGNLAVPTPSDWRRVRLPDALFLAYYLFRPLRVAFEAVAVPLVRALRRALRRRPADPAVSSRGGSG
jgi:hypothetical protein